jgi:hypothetical protein
LFWHCENIRYSGWFAKLPVGEKRASLVHWPRRRRVSFYPSPPGVARRVKRIHLGVRCACKSDPPWTKVFRKGKN